MRIDFHTHANLSKKIAVSLEEFKEKMRVAKASGLTALAITEHFNAANINGFYEILQAEFLYQNHYYEIEGMRVFCGLEIDVKERGHFLVIGSRDDIVTISEELVPYHHEEAFIPVADLIELLANFNVLKIGAHPLRESTPWQHHDKSVLKQFDAFDLNGKDLYTYHRDMAQRVHAFAETYDVPVVGGSDTHQMLQYGTIMNVFPACETIDDLKNVIEQGNYEIEISPQLETKVKEAKQIKKKVKAALAV